MRTSCELIIGLGLAALGLLGLAGAASAQVINTDVGLNRSFSQTDNTTVNETNAFFSARVFFTAAGDYTTGTLTLPSLDTRPLADQGYSPPFYEIGYEDVGTFTDLQAAYQPGTYMFDVSGGTQPATSVSQGYAGDAYPNTPLVTNFSSLQGLDVTLPFEVDFNGMIVSPNATPGENNLYFYVYNATTNSLVYGSGALDPSTLDVIIGANTLVAGTGYYFNLVYDDRIVDTSDPNITKTQFYDIGTAGDFTTGGVAPVPEPGTWAMLIVGFAGIGFMVRRRGIHAKIAA